MNKLFKAAVSLILGAALLMPTANAYTAFAETSEAEPSSESQSNPVVTGVVITNSKGTGIGNIGTKTEFNIRLTIRDLGIHTNEIAGAQDIDFIKSIDSFSGTMKGITIDSSGTDLLKFTVEFEKCRWDGGSTDFGFMLGYLSLGSSYVTTSAPVKQCQTSTGGDSPSDDIIMPEPFFKISAKEPSDPIKAGDEGSFELVLKNLGTADAERLLVEISSSDDILITESSSVQDVNYVSSGSVTSLVVRYKALDKINSSKQTFNVSVKYYYESGSNEMTGTSTGTINVESVVSTVEKVYPVVLSEFTLSEKELKPSTEYEGTVTLKNIGTADMKGIFVTFTAGDSFILTDNTTSCYIPAIEQGKSKKIPVKIKTLNEIASLKQDLGMSVKYMYVMGSEELDGSYENTFTMFAPISGGTAPKPSVTLDSLDKPLESGHRYKYYVNVENKGDIDMEDVKLTVKGSDGLILVKGSDSAVFDVIKVGRKKQALISFQTAAKLESPNQYLTVDMTYTYTTPTGKKSDGELSTVLSLDATVATAPVVRMYGENRDTAILPDNEYEYTVTIRNFGDIAVRDMYIDFTASDSLYFLEGTEYAYVESIKAGKSADVTLKFRTTKEMSGVKQVISAAMVYSYGALTSSSHAEGQSSVTLIAADGKQESAGGAAPNVIIGNYDIGAEQIAAGDVFNLALDFYNTSVSTPVENLVMTINAGGDLNIYGGGNTYFYPSLGAAGQLHEDISLRALATAATGTSTVSVSFKYDYLDGEQRNTVTSEQTVFVPVYQPDKITFDVTVPTYSVYAGNEVYITTSYLNKGRCDISNVKAEIVGDVSALSMSKIIGNVAPGGNGSFDFIVTPFMSGECSFTILITYEDANLNEVQKEIPVSFMVEEMMWEEPDGGDMPMTMESEGGSGGFPWLVLWIGIGVVVVGGVITIICVVRHKKKKAKKVTADDIDWEDDVDDIINDDTNKV